MRTTTSTNDSTNNSAIKFNINGNLVGFPVLHISLLKYFIKGVNATLNTYCHINNLEIAFLVKMRKDYISITNMYSEENIIKINISYQKALSQDEAESRARDFENVIGTSIEHYLNYLADEGVFDD